jgi:transposase-like protein
VTAGTVFHRTRTDLSKWFVAAYLMGRDKRGVSAKFLQRELAVADQTAWTMGHKLRHGLSQDAAHPLHGFLEADETFIGGRGDRTSPGRSTANPDKSLVVAAVEKVPAPKNKKGQHGHAVKRQYGFFAGNACIAVLPSATSAELGVFLKENVAAQSHLLTDGFAGYRGRDAALGEHLKHTPVVQDEGANAGEFFPIIHTLFSNIKAWLVGTHHGVSDKHLPRYLREWSYRFNRRNLPMDWTAISFDAPSNAPLSLTISSRQAPCQAAQIASGGFPLRLCNLL